MSATPKEAIVNFHELKRGDGLDIPLRATIELMIRLSSDSSNYQENIFISLERDYYRMHKFFQDALLTLSRGAVINLRFPQGSCMNKEKLLDETKQSIESFIPKLPNNPFEPFLLQVQLKDYSLFKNCIPSIYSLKTPNGSLALASNPFKLFYELLKNEVSKRFAILEKDVFRDSSFSNPPELFSKINYQISLGYYQGSNDCFRSEDFLESSQVRWFFENEAFQHLMSENRVYSNETFSKAQKEILKKILEHFCFQDLNYLLDYLMLGTVQKESFFFAVKRNCGERSSCESEKNIRSCDFCKTKRKENNVFIFKVEIDSFENEPNWFELTQADRKCKGVSDLNLGKERLEQGFVVEALNRTKNGFRCFETCLGEKERINIVEEKVRKEVCKDLEFGIVTEEKSIEDLLRLSFRRVGYIEKLVREKL